MDAVVSHSESCSKPFRPYIFTHKCSLQSHSLEASGFCSTINAETLLGFLGHPAVALAGGEEGRELVG